MLDIYKGIQNSIGALRSALRISISNADNFNTPGYKYTTASFTTVYSSVLSQGTDSINPMAGGSSMTLGSTNTDYSQGNIGIGGPLDVAISGAGLMILSESPQSFEYGSSNLYTRAGRFAVDFNNQYLTDTFGRKVFGYKVNSQGQITNPSPVPIQTDGYTDIGFSDGGVLVANYQAQKNAIASGTTPVPALIPLYKIALTDFKNKQGLIIVNGGAYKPTEAAGSQLTPSTSGELGYGDILPQALESSNIDVARVALDLNQINRGFSAIQGVIDDVNKIFSNMISKLG
ncbi:MAG: hypothetical protein AB7F28_06630 [Candidatus Margulisiibacteriota bacterium]